MVTALLVPPCGTGIGNSPPDRNSAAWPVCVVNVGSARIFARPFSLAASIATLKRALSVSRLAKNPLSVIPKSFGANSSITGPKGASLLNTGMRTLLGSNSTSGKLAPPLTPPQFHRLLFCRIVLKRTSSRRSSVRDISATFTSSMTCCTPPTDIRLIISPRAAALSPS